jgi:hypothetical protein
MADHNLEREDALWKTQESFGWTIAPDINFEWTSEMMAERQRRDKRRPTTAPHPHPHHPSIKSAKWKNRLLNIPTSTKKRGLPKGVRRPRTTKGTSVRFLASRRENEQSDSRFLPQPSSYYKASPYRITAPPISKQVKHPVPPPAGGDTLPISSKEWLTKQSVTMHGGKRSRGLSSTAHAKVASPFGLSPPKPSKHQMGIELSSQTSNMTHAKMLGRRLSFTLNYPKKLTSTLRGNLHVLMVKHLFMPVPPKNWPVQKTIGRREGCRIVVEWQGDTSNVWALLREINLQCDKLLLVSCSDFYLLERAHMYCRTFQDNKAMPTAQRHKLVTLSVVRGEGTTLDFEESPLQRNERERKLLIEFQKMEKLRMEADTRRNQRLFLKNIRARAELFKGPTKPPMESLSQHARTKKTDFGSELKPMNKQKVKNVLNGPGSFVTPLAMGKQLETRKRNVVAITSLNSVEQRESPEKHVPLGMREGPGPAHYDAFDPNAMVPTIKLGPGFTSGKETPEHIVCRKLYRGWKKYDQNIEKEQLKLNKEMKRIEAKERKMLAMNRGLRKIVSERMERNGFQKKKKSGGKKRKKKKKKIVIPERVGW